MKSILIQTYLVALPIVLGYIVWLLKQQKKSRDANSKGTMLLLRVQLIEYHAKYTKLGEIPSYAYQNFCEMYDAYHALGGNGMITKMKHEIEAMRNWKDWTKKAGIRAIKTVAQAAVAGIGTAAFMGAVDWKYVLSASVLAGVLSLLTSVAGIPEENINA